MSQVQVKARLWMEEELQKVRRDPALAEILGAPIPARHPDMLLVQGGVLVFGSTQPKKIADAKAVFRGANAKLKVVDPIQILHWFLSADEVSRTYIGNAYEKAQSILTRIYDQLGYDTVAARLKEKGLAIEDVMFCVNDCGASFNIDYSEEREF